jgi:hypothetical protein
LFGLSASLPDQFDFADSSRVRAKSNLEQNITTTQYQPTILARIRQYVLYTSYRRRFILPIRREFAEMFGWTYKAMSYHLWGHLPVWQLNPWQHKEKDDENTTL